MAKTRTDTGVAVNIREKLSLFTQLWAPKIVGEVGDMHVKLVKFKDEFVWHRHDGQDEMFLVVDGEMTLRFRDRDEVVRPGEFVIVPRGVEHMPVCAAETHIMMIEPKSTVNTGDAGGGRTVEPEWI